MGAVSSADGFIFTPMIKCFYFSILVAAFACDARPTPHVESTVKALATALKDNYIYEDKAEQMSEHLLKRLSEGRFDGEMTDEQLANLLHEEVRSVVDDKHLRIWLSSQGRSASNRREVPSYPNGFGKAKILADQVGYLDITGFYNPGSGFRADLTEQMTILSRAKAVILDLRNNGGGSPDAVQLISSYFFDRSKPVHLNTLYFRNRDSSTDFYTLQDIEGPDLSGKSLVILTSDYTFSAAEEFTYNMQSLKRATIVGETTGGGAHPVNRYTISEGIMAIIPVGRAINPITKTNWEAVGIKPDVEVDEESALDKAMELLSGS
ncbi:MAG: S41 family peptidase [Imperialibacter sp.]|uniref:S41 family peptidase n=1 Tax=Imperialibacter sp. TaxID=2038411 RepID=UPI0032EDAF8C